MARLPLLPSWRRDYLMAAYATAIGPCEDTANWSVLVRWFLKKVGLTSPAYWCMASVSTDGERAWGKRSPLRMTGSCEEQRARAITLGAYLTRAEFDGIRKADPMRVAAFVGFCIAWIDGAHYAKTGEATIVAEGTPGAIEHAHHTFAVGTFNELRDIVVNGPRGGWLTIEGNAADPAKPSSRNGDGKYEGRERGHPADTTRYGFANPEAYPL